MSLPMPRSGENMGFHKYSSTSYEGTLGDPEKIIWSSIRQLCARGVADNVLYSAHNITSRRSRDNIARNLRLYIEQAYEFYQIGGNAQANTAPLIYYYSFLNLAKAACEISRPSFHRSKESYRHGIGWKPNPKRVVSMASENILLTTRGVWHVLWEAIMNRSCKVRNPQTLRLRDLFALCPGIGVEFERTFGGSSRRVVLIDPGVMLDKENDLIWIKFSVTKENLNEMRLSRKKFLDVIVNVGGKYRQIRSDSDDEWAFELVPPIKIPPRFKGLVFEIIRPELNALNLLIHPSFDKLEYALPVQSRLPIVLPQIIVSYSIMFWLGSLVRYDPHSIDFLQESEYWILIDGFMNQSRVWLLELFEWHFYQVETILRLLR